MPRHYGRGQKQKHIEKIARLSETVTKQKDQLASLDAELWQTKEVLDVLVDCTDLSDWALIFTKLSPDLRVILKKRLFFKYGGQAKIKILKDFTRLAQNLEEMPFHEGDIEEARLILRDSFSRKNVEKYQSYEVNWGCGQIVEVYGNRLECELVEILHISGLRHSEALSS